MFLQHNVKMSLEEHMRFWALLNMVYITINFTLLNNYLSVTKPKPLILSCIIIRFINKITGSIRCLKVILFTSTWDIYKPTYSYSFWASFLFKYIVIWPQFLLASRKSKYLNSVLFPSFAKPLVSSLTKCHSVHCIYQNCNHSDKLWVSIFEHYLFMCFSVLHIFL